MASIYDLKPAFQNLLRPIVRNLAKRGVTANQITLSALGLSAVTGALLALTIPNPTFFVLVPITLFLRMALNAIDGMLAREHQMKSPLGAVLNELCDVLSDIALYLPFALLPEIDGWLVTLIVLAAVLTEMTGVIAVQIGSTRRYDGPMGKSDRAFVFGVIALAIALGAAPGLWLTGLLGLILALTIMTIVNRARFALEEITL